MKKILYVCCWLLEILCYLTHPFVWFEINLTGRNCNLTELSLWLNDRFDVGYWR